MSPQSYTACNNLLTLFLSAKTVGTYQTRILAKLNANNLSDLTRLAIRMGYIEA